MNVHALTIRPLATAFAGFLMAIAVLLCLSSSAVAQEAPENPSPPPAEMHTATADSSQDGEETAQTDTSEAQARLDNPFGHTRPMFGPDGVRGNR